ncbi:hypothetical protein ABT093_09915 [Kitasatospora sp. NPDC002551]|uniref:hypothetical protein n=1 Tax=Kitasatospora sp. NPDC002551 TaxID=3154539 RepID=UPI00331A1CD2
MRRRIRYTTRPRPAIALVDRPHPDCTTCAGHGGYQVPDVDGESAYDEYCDCWHPDYQRVFLPIPTALARRLPGYIAPSAESPF